MELHTLTFQILQRRTGQSRISKCRPESKRLSTNLQNRTTNLLTQDLGEGHSVNANDVDRRRLLLEDRTSQFHADEAGTDDCNLCILVEALRV